MVNRAFTKRPRSGVGPDCADGLGRTHPTLPRPTRPYSTHSAPSSNARPPTQPPTAIREMYCRGKGSHHVVHDPTQIEIEIVPVGKGIHESGAFVGWGHTSSLNADPVLGDCDPEGTGVPGVRIPAINARSLFSGSSKGEL